MAKCNCDWCIGTAGSDDLSLAEKAVQINEDRKRREESISDDDRRRIGKIFRDIGIIR